MNKTGYFKRGYKIDHRKVYDSFQKKHLIKHTNDIMHDIDSLVITGTAVSQCYIFKAAEKGVVNGKVH